MIDQPTLGVASGYDRPSETWDQWNAAVTPDLRASHLTALEKCEFPDRTCSNSAATSLYDEALRRQIAAGERSPLYR